MPALPLRITEARRRALLQMFTSLYGLETVTTTLLQRLWTASAPRVALLRRDLALRDGAPQNRAPTIHGDGEQSRDFTYVANVVDGVLRACEAPAPVAVSSMWPPAAASRTRSSKRCGG